MTSKADFFTILLPLAGALFLIALGVIVLYQQFRKNLYQQMLEQEELKNKHQLDLLNSTIEAQERERKRIAQDMHDELGAILALIRMQVVQEANLNAANKDLFEKLDRIRINTEAALVSMRKLSHELMPAHLQIFGLVKTLQTLVNQVNDTKQITIHFNAVDDIKNLPMSTTLAIYRICMEMIHNTLKHGQAKNIFLEIQIAAGCLMVSYADDGIGLPENRNFSGLGFKNIQARVNSINGALTIENRKSGGFSAEIVVPKQ